jgi:hypothetical protein
LVLCAFDLIELDGEDLRRSPFEQRKRALAELLRLMTDGIILNVHYEGDGADHAAKIIQHALGIESIASSVLASSANGCRPRRVFLPDKERVAKFAACRFRSPETATETTA